MKLIIYSQFNAETVQKSLGAPDYNYYFLSQYLARTLAKKYDVTWAGPNLEKISAFFKNAADNNEKCFCLAFCSPQLIPKDFPCPVIPFFAWAFNSLPNDLNDDPAENWLNIFTKYGTALTFSTHAAETVKQSLGKDFPIAVIPAPTYEYINSLPLSKARKIITFKGNYIDLQTLDLEGFAWNTKQETIPPVFNAFSKDIDARLKLNGTVYFSILNPKNPLKNWLDLIKAFCFTFKKEPDATLVIKTVNIDLRSFIFLCLSEAYRLHPFKCRVVIMRGLLSDEEMKLLYTRSDFIISTSQAESVGVPLLEGMSLGKPVIAPDHTALSDYVNKHNAFIIPSNSEPTHWPHDMRQNLRAQKYRLNWTKLTKLLSDSFRMKTKKPEAYEKKSAQAKDIMKEFCSDEVVIDRFSTFMEANMDKVYIPPVPKPAAKAADTDKPQNAKLVPMPVLPVGQELSINNERPEYRRWFDENWFNLGPGGIWMKGASGQINLKPVLAKSGTIELGFNALLPAGQTNRLKVNLNKREVFEQEIDPKNRKFKIAFTVEKEDFKDGELHFTLTVDRCFKPADFVKESNDQRELSVRLQTAEFKSKKKKAKS